MRLYTQMKSLYASEVSPTFKQKELWSAG